MSPLRPAIYDHRGRVFRLFIPRRPLLVSLRGPDVPAPVIHRLQKKLATAGFPAPNFAPPIWFDLVRLAMLASFIPLSIVRPAWYGVGIVALIGGLDFVSRPLKFRRLRRDIARAYLYEELCPACGYSLAEVPEIDNFTTCPECGAAWIIPLERCASRTPSPAPASAPPAAAATPPTPDR